MRQANVNVLVEGNIYASDTGHYLISELTLALFVTWV